MRTVDREVEPMAVRCDAMDAQISTGAELQDAGSVQIELQMIVLKGREKSGRSKSD